MRNTEVLSLVCTRRALMTTKLHISRILDVVGPRRVYNCNKSHSHQSKSKLSVRLIVLSSHRYTLLHLPLRCSCTRSRELLLCDANDNSSPQAANDRNNSPSQELALEEVSEMGKARSALCKATRRTPVYQCFVALPSAELDVSSKLKGKVVYAPVVMR